MKVIAVFMVICMCLVSVSSRSAELMQYDKTPKCCLYTGTAGPCKSHKSDKAAAMCLTRLCCNVAGFTTNKPMHIVPTVPVDLKNKELNLEQESTIDFSYPFWQPPKIML